LIQELLLQSEKSATNDQVEIVGHVAGDFVLMCGPASRQGRFSPNILGKLFFLFANFSFGPSQFYFVENPHPFGDELLVLVTSIESYVAFKTLKK